MQELKDNKIIMGFSFLYIALSAYLVWTDLTFLVLAPIGIMAIYFAIFHTEYMYLAIAFLTPLSINIEEFTESFGLYVPTEPLLFGMMCNITSTTKYIYCSIPVNLKIRIHTLIAIPKSPRPNRRKWFLN